MIPDVAEALGRAVGPEHPGGAGATPVEAVLQAALA
jgi:hypothetical protein